MSAALHTAHITHKPWEAFFVFLGSFFILAVFLNLIDFVPEKPEGAVATAASEQAPFVSLNEVTTTARAKNVNLVAGPAPAVIGNAVGLAPTRVVIGAIGVDTPVLNPRSTSLADLDEELLNGAVRYPGTAFLDEEGSVLIFGHQSYLPVVHNKAFKAFNDVQELKQGDTVSVYSGNTEYRYAVRSVTLVSTDIGTIPLETRGRTLVLVTCNSLGGKEERYIVRADFVGTF